MGINYDPFPPQNGGGGTQGGLPGRERGRGRKKNHRGRSICCSNFLTVVHLVKINCFWRRGFFSSLPSYQKDLAFPERKMDQYQRRNNARKHATNGINGKVELNSETSGVQSLPFLNQSQVLTILIVHLKLIVSY